MQQFVTTDKISLLSQAACKLKQAWHINSTGRYKLKHRGAWRRKKGECSRRKALQRNAKEDEQRTCSRSKEAQLQEETRARHKGRSVSKGCTGGHWESPEKCRGKRLGRKPEGANSPVHMQGLWKEESPKGPVDQEGCLLHPTLELLHFFIYAHTKWDASRWKAPIKGLTIFGFEKLWRSSFRNVPEFCSFMAQTSFNCRSAWVFKCIFLYLMWLVFLGLQQQGLSCMFEQHMHKALTLSTATECIRLFQFYMPGTEQTLNKCCPQNLAAHPSQSNFPWSQNLKNSSPRRKHWLPESI